MLTISNCGLTVYKIQLRIISLHINFFLAGQQALLERLWALLSCLQCAPLIILLALFMYVGR